MNVLTQVVVWLNRLADLIGGVLLAPIGLMPGWLSATLVAAVTGVLLLLAFKYTSNQRAIKIVRDDIKANLLALKLFKESTSVALRAQARVLAGAFWLMVYAIVPMLIMVIPVCLILGQLGLWYQARPLRVDEEAVVSIQLNTQDQTAWADTCLQTMDVVKVIAGPIRIPSKSELCWKVKAQKPGYHELGFRVGKATYHKELAIGDDIMRVSQMRPGWNWTDALLHPCEPPFRPDSPVRAIKVDYPERSSWTSGTDSWVIFWFIASMVAAFGVRPWMNVNI
jgi:hypothetical protein